MVFHQCEFVSAIQTILTQYSPRYGTESDYEQRKESRIRIQDCICSYTVYNVYVLEEKHFYMHFYMYLNFHLRVIN